MNLPVEVVAVILGTLFLCAMAYAWWDMRETRAEEQAS